MVEFNFTIYTQIAGQIKLLNRLTEKEGSKKK